MPSCNRCHHKWTWKDTMRRTFRKKKKCPYCGEIQYTTWKSSQLMAWYCLILPIICVLISLFSLPTTIGVFASAIIFVIGILTQPFLTKLTDEEEFPQ